MVKNTFNAKSVFEKLSNRLVFKMFLMNVFFVKALSRTS